MRSFIFTCKLLQQYHKQLAHHRWSRGISWHQREETKMKYWQPAMWAERKIRAGPCCLISQVIPSTSAVRATLRNVLHKSCSQASHKRCHCALVCCSVIRGMLCSEAGLASRRTHAEGSTERGILNRTRCPNFGRHGSAGSPHGCQLHRGVIGRFDSALRRTDAESEMPEHLSIFLWSVWISRIFFSNKFTGLKRALQLRSSEEKGRGGSLPPLATYPAGLATIRWAQQTVKQLFLNVSPPWFGQIHHDFASDKLNDIQYLLKILHRLHPAMIYFITFFMAPDVTFSSQKMTERNLPDTLL